MKIKTLSTIYLLIICLLLVCLLLTSCKGYGEPKFTFEFNYEGSVKNIISADGIVSRYIDPEFNNICYVFRTYKGGGISCVPLSQTGVDY